MFPYFEIFGKTHGTYTLISLVGLFVAGIFACCTAKKRGFDDNDMLVTLLVAAVGVLIGGHLLYGLVNFQQIIQLFRSLDEITGFGDFFTRAHEIFGGSVFYGGLFGGIAAGTIYMKKKKLNISEFSDIAAPAVPLFHVFGRIGCFFGGCCYGVESDFGFVVAAPGSDIISRRFPIQLVEAAFNLLLFLALYLLLKRGWLNGRLIYLYLLCYSVGRFIIEFWRGDAYRGFWLGLSTSQWISIVLFVVSATLLFWKYLKKSKKAGPA